MDVVDAVTVVDTVDVLVVVDAMDVLVVVDEVVVADDNLSERPKTCDDSAHGSDR